MSKGNVVEAFGELMSWPLYINDNGVVSCYGGVAECGPATFESIGRRCTVQDLLVEIRAHIDWHRAVDE